MCSNEKAGSGISTAAAQTKISWAAAKILAKGNWKFKKAPDTIKRKAVGWGPREILLYTKYTVIKQNNLKQEYNNETVCDNNHFSD